VKEDEAFIGFALTPSNKLGKINEMGKETFLLSLILRNSYLAVFVNTLLFYSICANLYSQTKIDSLVKELMVSTDTNKVMVLYELAFEYRKLNTDTALQYANEGLKLGEKIGFQRGIAESNNIIGIIYRMQADYIEALKYHEKSHEIFNELNYKPGIANCLNSKGILYSRLRQIDKALSFYLSSLKIHDELNDKQEIANLSNNIGTIYQKKGILDTALFHYRRSLSMNKVLNNVSSIGYCFINIGEIYENLEKYDSAAYFYFESLRIFENLEDKRGLINSNFYVGKYYNSIFEFEKALPFLTIAFENAREVGTIEQVGNTAKELAKSYGKLRQFEKGYYYQGLSDSIVYRLNLAEVEKSIALTEIYYEIEKENEVRDLKLKRQKLLRNFSIIAFGLTLGLAFFILRNYRIKNKANKLLAEMDEMKSRLFSNISHEFRTPLTLILGPLEEMLELEKEKKPGKKAVQMMQRNANRLLDLVNQMLDLSKVDAGSTKLELVEGEIFKAMRVMILSFASLAEKKKIDFSYQLPGKKLVTWFDPDKLEKILNNLISNAFKFTPERRAVKVEVRLDQQHERPSQPARLLITVEDSGKGIPDDQLEKIFDRFHQVEEAKEFETVGTGIGLALTKELVEVMHGKISVESQVGKGTKFNIELPVGKEHLKESEYVIRESDATMSERKAREPVTMTEEEEYREEICSDEESSMGYPIVLTIEDHEEIRTHIREHLEDNFRVLEAANGKTGLDIAIENVPDLIITDLMMPEMDGVELCKRLKTDERTSHIPVIMLTAKASIEDRLEGLETGADAYVTKPFHIKELRLRVSKLIEQRNKLRERFSREITLEPKDIAVTSTDERFLQKAMACVEEHMGDSDFDVGQFQDEMSMSRMQLFRKLKALTNHTPSEFIRNLRLKRAARLIEKDFGNVAEVCYEVGFNNLSYFAKCFKDLFKVLPSEYGKTKG